MAVRIFEGRDTMCFVANHCLLTSKTVLELGSGLMDLEVWERDEWSREWHLPLEPHEHIAEVTLRHC